MVYFWYDEISTRRRMNPEIHPNARKHLTEEEVRHAWNAVTKCIRRESPEEPPRWLAIGWLPNGDAVELIAVEIVTGWLVIHAKSPVEPRFSREIEKTERREK
jgi:hypothetical protein